MDEEFKKELLILVKRHLRLDGSEDDSFLIFLIDSSIEELEKSGVKNDASTVYKRLVCLSVVKAHEGEETPKNLDKSIQTLTLKLKSW